MLFLKKGKFNHLKSTISAYSIIENLSGAFFYAKAHSWLSPFSYRKKISRNSPKLRKLSQINAKLSWKLFVYIHVHVAGEICHLSIVSVGWDVKWCPVSRITTPLARKRPFHWISMKSRLVREISKFHNWLLLTFSRRRYIAEILPISRNTLSNQSINHLSISFFVINHDAFAEFIRLVSKGI